MEGARNEGWEEERWMMGRKETEKQTKAVSGDREGQRKQSYMGMIQDA